MKIFKMIIIFMLCFLLVGCGDSKEEISKETQVKEAYFDKGLQYANYKLKEIYNLDSEFEGLENLEQAERDEFLLINEWLINQEALRLGLKYSPETNTLTK